jgi:rhamnose utilization protein RhaD (predicted bifunctional aldolase and dehydrogenase)
MTNRYNIEEASNCKDDLDLRVYTSRLLGSDDSLVLHGGGNTSVKMQVDGEDILFVKGSGWDLRTIERAGFAPVKMDALLQMASLETLSDSDMVSGQKAAMIDQSAPNPSVEAILHAIIPYKFVDHTHSDAVVTISNSANGKEIISEIYKDFLIIDYVMPGFILAQEIYKMTKDQDYSKIKGIILHNHGIFTFDDDAKRAYDKMIEAVQVSEDYLSSSSIDIEKLRSLISQYKNQPTSAHINTSFLARSYANLPYEAISRGVLTPEHIIRTKRKPLYICDNDYEQSIKKYILEYESYFQKYATDEVMLNPAPNYAVIKGFGVICFGKNKKEASIINDIITHTMEAVFNGDRLGGFQSISESDSFAMEYWELEQAKLKKG